MKTATPQFNHPVKPFFGRILIDGNKIKGDHNALCAAGRNVTNSTQRVAIVGDVKGDHNTITCTNIERHYHIPDEIKELLYTLKEQNRELIGLIKKLNIQS